MHDLFTTLEQAKADYTSEIESAIEGSSKEYVFCPCCEQGIKIYKRTIDRSSALTMVCMYKANEYSYVHVTKAQINFAGINAGGYFAQLVHWGLIEESTEHLPEHGSRKAGYWRITEKGKAFIKGEISVPKYSHTLKNQSIGFSGEMVSFKQCLPENFDYHSMMKREGWAA